MHNIRNRIISININVQTLKRLDQEAEHAQRTRSQFVNILLEREFKRIDQQKTSSESL